jgi:outer membrane protein assembly factor BamD (BamD/ComL family)
MVSKVVDSSLESWFNCERRFRDVFNTASRSDEVVESHRILVSAYFTHGEYKRAAQVDAILALKEK